MAGLWAANLVGVLILWVTTSGSYFGDADKLYGWILAFGQLAGLLATYFALVQFMLMGRVGWIEKHFGLDHLAHFHRLNGYAAITAIVIHPILIIMAYSIAAQTGFVAQYVQAVTSFPYVWMALIAEILFIAVVATSVYLVRRHLRFETWYYVHFMVYAAIVLAFWHQFALGGSLNGHPLARNYWYALYIFVALNVLWWRFGLSTFNLLRFRFQISRVVPETDTATSVYIKGKGLGRWKVRPGQYVMIRILAWPYVRDEHPFSVSGLPDKTTGEFRITVRDVGDYTHAVRVALAAGCSAQSRNRQSGEPRAQNITYIRQKRTDRCRTHPKQGAGLLGARHISLWAAGHDGRNYPRITGTWRTAGPAALRALFTP